MIILTQMASFTRFPSNSICFTKQKEIRLDSASRLWRGNTFEVDADGGTQLLIEPIIGEP